MVQMSDNNIVLIMRKSKFSFSLRKLSIELWPIENVPF